MYWLQLRTEDAGSAFSSITPKHWYQPNLITWGSNPKDHNMKTVCVLTDVWEDIQPARLPSETLHDPHRTPSTPLRRVS